MGGSKASSQGVSDIPDYPVGGKDMTLLTVPGFTQDVGSPAVTGFKNYYDIINPLLWIKKAYNRVGSSLTQHPYGDGCFGCGATDNWIKACP
ncbi:hypothetical protein BVC80_27g16 [Macleaya cordata]|uniref:Uncharacterized protein n=1 Tax=Macleaya cordata TaxID=56857 RepID=A0A200QFF5_MACCD|nr:hypothetical protein BVC80_27g16 [Macleaya cordata]